MMQNPMHPRITFFYKKLWKWAKDQNPLNAAPLRTFDFKKTYNMKLHYLNQDSIIKSIWI